MKMAKKGFSIVLHIRNENTLCIVVGNKKCWVLKTLDGRD